MLVSFLISTLQAKYAAQPYELFAKEHPYPWLVWEPGPWMPAASAKGKTAVLPALAAKRPASPGAEALATPLKLEKGATVVTVGREASSISINDATLSRHHLELSPGASGWQVQDLGSSNGTWLNSLPLGAKVQAALRDGAQLQAGAVYLTFHDPAGMHRRLKGG